MKSDGSIRCRRSVDYFEHLLCESLVTSYARGVPVRERRRKKGVRGEALDARVYSFAALHALIAIAPSLERECERIEATGLHPPIPTNRVMHSRWMQA